MSSTTKPDNVAAVMKVFAVLEALSEEKSMTLTDLAQKALTSKSTVYRFLQTMQDLGYVRQEEGTEKYALTLKLFTVGARVLNYHMDLMSAADKPMQALSEASHEGVHLGVLDRMSAEVIYIHKYDSHFDLGMRMHVGKRNYLHSTSLGKVILAYSDPQDVDALMAKCELRQLTPNTLTSVDALHAQFQTIRAQGYAEEIEESEIGVRCIAVPVFDYRGKIAAAISMSFPIIRFDESRKDEYIRLIKKTGADASVGLGWQHQ